MSLEVNITKKLDGFTLHANFAARSTATAILGASGCGKSMTLRCIAGIVKPDKGRIVLDGTVLFDSEQHIDLPPQQRGVGLLFQNYALYPHLTVRQNITFPLENRTGKDKLTHQQMADMALEAAKLVQIEELMDRKPKELSGGQQQRVAIARALVNNPSTIVADEPTGNLDSENSDNIIDLLLRLAHEENRCVIVVTHDLTVMDRADVVYRISDGLLQRR